MSNKAIVLDANLMLFMLTPENTFQPCWRKEG